MPIRLNSQQKNYLRLKLKNITDTDFLGKAILKEVEDDDERISNMNTCHHTPADYEGSKKCCSKCGDFLIEGGYERWTIKELNN